MREDRSWSELCAAHQFTAAQPGLTRSLPLKNSYRARAACDPHIVTEECSWRSGPFGNFGSQEFDAFIPITDQDFGVSARRWRQPMNLVTNSFCGLRPINVRLTLFDLARVANANCRLFPKLQSAGLH